MKLSDLCAQQSALTTSALAAYGRATPDEVFAGRAWYPLATELLSGWAIEHGEALETVCALTAAISPQVSWENNLQVAKTLLETGEATGPAVLRRNAEIARIILERRYLAPIGFKSAPKVWAFYENLRGERRAHATIDTHMVQAMMGDVRATVCLNEPRYRIFERALFDAAENVGLPAAELQAIIWLVWKREHPTTEKQKERRQW